VGDRVSEQAGDGYGSGGDEPGGDEQSQMEPVGVGSVRLDGGGSAQPGGNGDRRLGQPGFSGRKVREVQVALIGGCQHAG
jgi:hypothetical protein